MPEAHIALVDQNTPDSLGRCPSSVTRWKVFRSRLITGTANLAVQYNYNDIAWSGKVWIASLYSYPCWADALSSNIIFIGTVFGMLVLGYAGDVLGRNNAMVLAVALMAVAAFLSALLPWGDTEAVWVTLICCRFLIGVGAGGVYPLASTKAAEDTQSRRPELRSEAAAWGYFWRNPAIILVYLLGYVLAETVGQGAHIVSNCDSIKPYGYNVGWEVAWRIHLAFGAVPVILMLAEAMRQEDAPEALAARNNSLSLMTVLRRGGFSRQLAATAGGWFASDFAYYGTSLVQPLVLKIIFEGDHKMHNLGTEALENSLVACMGVFFTLFTIPMISFVGTRSLQVFGFSFTAVLSLILACGWAELERQQLTAMQFGSYTMLYGSYWICNITTFVLPTETYPTEVRSSLSGISAATGKVGAVVGIVVFRRTLTMFEADYEGVQMIFALCSIANLCGACLTLCGVGLSKPACLTRQSSADTSQRESSKHKRPRSTRSV